MTNPIDRFEFLIKSIQTELESGQIEKRIRCASRARWRRTSAVLPQRADEGHPQGVGVGRRERGGRRQARRLERRVREAKMPKHVEEQALSKSAAWARCPRRAPKRASCAPNVDTLIDIPWTKMSEVNQDIARARQVLEEDHWGLEKVKERILEYLAVQKRVGKVKSPILCLVGGPGVGKTSLGRSIARATNREYVRMALGGVSDEAEIRGHRRTYVGAMPGQVIKHLIKAGVRTPCSFWTKSTRSGRTTAATRRRRSSRSSTPSRTTRLKTTTSSARTTCRTCSSWQPRTATTFRPRFLTAWK